MTHLPDALGERPRLQKLLLAGNRLTALPTSLAGSASLELLRIAANRLEALPAWLAEAPALAWLGWAGNPFEAAPSAAQGRPIAWSELFIGQLLGEGASGWVSQAVWRPPHGSSREVAVKVFKGAMTSDGLPEHETAACLAAGGHPHLTGALGRVVGHPSGAVGLVMPLLPADWRILAGPPSRESCSRDVYPPGLRLEGHAALAIAGAAAEGCAHLHGAGLTHGDLYAHNILWDGAVGGAVLSDLGAASAPPGPDRERWTKPDVLAWGRLAGELLDRCASPPAILRELHAACVSPAPDQRPRLTDVAGALGQGRTPEMTRFPPT